MSTRDPKDLTPEMYERFLKWEILMQGKGLYFILTRVACSPLEQKALYSQGRDPLWLVNEYRHEAGLPSIPFTENHKITWTLNSLHVVSTDHPKARAFDFAITLRDHKKVFWGEKVDTNSSGGPDYEEAGKIWESLGGVWGGRWETPDRPHCQ